MGFRFINQLPQFFNASGQVMSGGQLAFYESGTTTPLDTYTDETLTQANPNPLELDSTGRPTADIWMDGNYRVVLLDNTGATIWTRDDVQQPGGTTFSLPSLVAGQFLTNDGTNPLWAAITQVPSVAGATGKFLSNDGSNTFWAPPPSNGSNGTNADVSASQTSTTIGGGSGDQFFVQSGTGSAPASGTENTQVSITFPTAFKALSGVLVMPNIAGVTGGGYNGVPAVTSQSTTGFTVQLSINGGAGAPTINTSIPFTWIAFGTTPTP